MNPPKMSSAGIGKGRVEALADGIFAIAMTLLILDVKVPALLPDQIDQLPNRLLQLWPKMASFVISFLICGVYWVGHHALLHYVRRSDRTFMWLNIAFFLVISAIPFSAALIGEYPQQPTAIRVYCGNLILAGVVLFGQLRYAAGRGQLYDQDIDARFITSAGRRILMGPAVYLVASLLASVSPITSLILCGAAPVLYLLPGQVDQYWKNGHRTTIQEDSLVK
ncbi:DUF1211 domain-containing protein [Telmatocola sphagniphila]|uniref:DUF1211 domain-containing protein n=1 Tax=Telmatocola sphagniphila TaxID=1123043 RepID=A0A8E6EX04_9BACT|nr:TMEM175 family protein [Telmatocola sphagniphila]QVL30746.1 DUF1211 domain-containing protein [Telmatocola sphagniphila]